MLTLSVSLIFAQTPVSRVGGHPFHSTRPASGGGVRYSAIISGGGFPHHRFPPFLPPYYATPYWPYYEVYDYAPEYLPEEAPAAAPRPAVVKNEPLPDPVLLELKDGRWVRVTSFGEAAEKRAAASGEPMAPALLVYRDGHREEVTNYSIIGAALYTRSNYWTTGAWTRTIQLSDLDLAATVKANHERGVKFDLPSGPDEIVIRP